eukprot:COSAG02_NODE_5301_length_4458_cov_75.446662_1_plen_86_part_00
MERKAPRYERLQVLLEACSKASARFEARVVSHTATATVSVCSRAVGCGNARVLVRFARYNNIPTDIQTDIVVLMLAPPLPRISNL